MNTDQPICYRLLQVDNIHLRIRSWCSSCYWPILHCFIIVSSCNLKMMIKTMMSKRLGLFDLLNVILSIWKTIIIRKQETIKLINLDVLKKCILFCNSSEKGSLYLFTVIFVQTLRTSDFISNSNIISFFVKIFENLWKYIYIYLNQLSHGTWWKGNKNSLLLLSTVRITKPFGDNSADAYALSHDSFAWQFQN